MKQINENMFKKSNTELFLLWPQLQVQNFGKPPIKENAFMPLYINYIQNLPGFDLIPAPTQRAGTAGL